jgi:hypothetical protein
MSIGRPENHRFVARSYRMHLAELGGTVTVIVLMYDGRRFYMQDGIGHRTAIAARRLGGSGGNNWTAPETAVCRAPGP